MKHTAPLSEWKQKMELLVIFSKKDTHNVKAKATASLGGFTEFLLKTFFKKRFFTGMIPFRTSVETFHWTKGSSTVLLRAYHLKGNKKWFLFGITAKTLIIFKSVGFVLTLKTGLFSNLKSVDLNPSVSILPFHEAFINIRQYLVISWPECCI